MKPLEIEARSFEIIAAELGDRKLDPEYDPVIRRVIHATADFDYADALAFSGGTAVFPRRNGWSLSVFALTDACDGVSIRGTKYECENAALTNAFPLGVSNVWAAEEAVISVKSGILLAIQSKLQKEEHI